MAEKGLSPRQKMINVMYLFLTALLALNVSAEILNAFILIDESIQASTKNVSNKNGEVYSEFSAAKEENPKKVGEWFDKAMKLKAASDNLDSLVSTLKKELVVAADGPEGDVNNIKKKDDNNVGGEVMVLKGRGEDLRKEINEYRDYVLDLIEDRSESAVLVSSIERTLNTDDIESHSEPGTKIPWVSANFEHLPLIAVVAMMSKMQNDIRNVESDMLAYMLGRIGKSDFRFNKVEAIVNAPVSYVNVGQPYTAEVFVAAADTTKEPVIILNNGTKLDVKNGKGVYTGATGTPGTFSWGGRIVLEDPGTGDTISYPFRNEYQVVAPTYAVAADKMNVFYIGLDNPVTITGTGKTISATISGAGGRLIGTGNGTYNVKVTKRGDARITVSADGKTMGTKKFRCLPVPDPYAVVGGKKAGMISKSSLLAQKYVKAKLENFVYDVKFTVTEFTVSATISGFTQEIRASGGTITGQQKGLIKDLKRGDKVYFEKIKARAPDGSIRSLGSVIFKIK